MFFVKSASIVTRWKRPNSSKASVETALSVSTSGDDLGLLAPERGILAVFYLYSGGAKVVRSRDGLRPMMGWVDDMPFAFVRIIGVLEVLGALGLILPPLTGIATWLALVAAVGLVLVQIGALIVHLRR